MMKPYTHAKEIGKMTGTSDSTGYKIARKLNAELKSQGYIVISGRVPTRYLMERLYGDTVQGAE